MHADWLPTEPKYRRPANALHPYRWRIVPSPRSTTVPGPSTRVLSACAPTKISASDGVKSRKRFRMKALSAGTAGARGIKGKTGIERPARRSIVFFGLLLSPRAQDEAEGRQRTAAILTIVSDNVAPSVDTEGRSEERR